MNPDIAEWSTTLRTNMILADLFDMLSMIYAQLRVIASHKRGQPPKPYKRPWEKKKNIQHYGSGALPANEMREWIKQKQKAG